MRKHVCIHQDIQRDYYIAYTRTPTRLYTHACIHIIIDLYTHIRRRTCIHVYIHAPRHSEKYIAYINTYIHNTYIIHTYRHTYTHTYIHTYIHTYTHTYLIRTYMHAYIHTYMHAYNTTKIGGLLLLHIVLYLSFSKALELFLEQKRCGVLPVLGC